MRVAVLPGTCIYIEVPGNTATLIVVQSWRPNSLLGQSRVSTVSYSLPIQGLQAYYMGLACETDPYAAKNLGTQYLGKQNLVIYPTLFPMMDPFKNILTQSSSHIDEDNNILYCYAAVL